MEIEPKKHEFMGKKLKRLILVRNNGAGPSTPPCPWRLQLSPQNGENPFQEFVNYSPVNNTVSARKLCGFLWETQPHHHRRRRRCPNSKESKPVTANGLRSHVAVSPMQTNRSDQRNDHVPHHISCGRYSNSMEVAESRYNIGRSKEFHKVLNRMWSLEDCHASNMTLVKALKVELDSYRARTKKLMKDKQRERQKIDNLLKHIVDIKLVRHHKEQDRVNAAVQSAREELEVERKLRKNSEELYHKVSRELSHLKSSFSYALKQLQSERNTRILLENLCDEFAKGIRDYEAEVRSVKQNVEMDQIGRRNADRVVLHIAKAWINERMEMRKNVKLSVNELKESSSCCHSSESIPLNETVSAPRDADSLMKKARPHKIAMERVHRNMSSKSRQSNDGLDNVTSIHLLSFERNKFQSVFGGHTSPVQQWMSKLTYPDFEKSESSVNGPRGSKTNTSKPKLVKARLEVQRSRAKEDKIFT